MTTKEFNLSKKRDKFYDNSDNCKGLYWEEDVKEFVRLLKERLQTIVPNTLFNQELDNVLLELAGKSLVEEKK